jgi:hypothetical protein
MRSLSAKNLAALQARRLVAQDFLWIVARDRVTGDLVAEGQHSGPGVITEQVVNPNTGGAVERTFYGSGELTQISDIPLVANLTVQSVTIRMSQVNDRVEALVRQYDCKQAQVEIFRGLYNLDTRQLVAPAECRFAGFDDLIEIKTPAENEEGGVFHTCKSHTQELTRANAATRSHEDQQLRLEGDAFLADSHVAGLWPQFWGRASGHVGTPTKGAFG